MTSANRRHRRLRLSMAFTIVVVVSTTKRNCHWKRRIVSTPFQMRQSRANPAIGRDAHYSNVKRPTVGRWLFVCRRRPRKQTIKLVTHRGRALRHSKGTANHKAQPNCETLVLWTVARNVCTRLECAPFACNYLRQEEHGPLLRGK